MALSPGSRQARRQFLLTMAGAAALALAGCQGGMRRAPGPYLPGPATPAQPNLVAVIVPLTGSDGPIGQSIANAANLALYDIGDKSIRLVTYDSAKDCAVAAANRAIGEGAGLILGPLLAEDVRAAAPVARNGHGLVEEAALSDSEAGHERLVMGLRLAEGIEPGRLVDDDAVERMIGHGLMWRIDTRVGTTEAGRLLLDSILAEIAA